MFVCLRISQIFLKEQNVSLPVLNAEPLSPSCGLLM